MNTDTRYRLWAAAVIMTLYAALCAYMIFVLSASPQNSPRWDHALVIFNAFGAIATTAAGVLLGTEIQQQNVNAANQEVARVKAAARTALSALNEPASAERTSDASNGRHRAADLLTSII